MVTSSVRIGLESKPLTRRFIVLSGEPAHVSDVAHLLFRPDGDGCVDCDETTTVDEDVLKTRRFLRSIRAVNMNAQIVSSERSIFFPKLHSPSNSDSRLPDNGVDVEGKVKTRLLSVWNNVKYGTYFV